MSWLLILERKQKISSNDFRIRIFLFCSYFLELKRWIRSYTGVVPSKTIPDSRPKLAKSIPVFRPKRPKTHTFWSGTYLYGLYRGVLWKDIQSIYVKGTGSPSSACSLIKLLFSNLLLILLVNNPSRMYLSYLREYFKGEVYFRVTWSRMEEY